MELGSHVCRQLLFYCWASCYVYERLRAQKRASWGGAGWVGESKEDGRKGLGKFIL